MGGWSPTTINGFSLSIASSALQKCIRRGAEKDAVFWATEIAESVYDQYLMKRRLLIVASEDVSLADPYGLGVVLDARDRWLHARLTSRGGHELINADFISIAEAVLYLCRAGKDRSSDDAGWWMSCRFGETDKTTGIRKGRDPKTGEAVPPLVLPLPDGTTEIDELRRCLREKRELEAVYWAFSLCAKGREREIWGTLSEIGSEVIPFVQMARMARESFYEDKKEPDRCLLTHAILLVCRQDHLKHVRPTVPDGYKEDAREIVREIISRRRGIDPSTGQAAIRWIAQVHEEYDDAHCEGGRRRLKLLSKQKEVPFLYLWNKQFYEDVARVARRVEIPGEQNWMEKMCVEAGCDWEKYKTPPGPFTPVLPPPERAKIEEVGDHRYRVEFPNETGVVYLVDPLGRTCRCPFALKYRRPCRHLVAVLRRIWEKRS